MFDVDILWTMDSRAIRVALLVNVIVLAFFGLCLRLLTHCLKFSGALKGLFQDHVEYFDIVDEAEEAKIAFLRPHTRRARDYEYEKKMRLRKQQRVAQSKRVWFPRTLLGVVHMLCPFADALTFAAFAFASPTPLSATSTSSIYGNSVYYLHIITRYFLLDFSSIYSESDHSNLNKHIIGETYLSEILTQGRDEMKTRFLVSFWAAVGLAVLSVVLFISGVRNKSTNPTTNSKKPHEDTSLLDPDSEFPVIDSGLDHHRGSGDKSSKTNRKHGWVSRLFPCFGRHQHRSSKSCCSKISRGFHSFASGVYKALLHLGPPIFTAPICSSLMRTFACAYPHTKEATSEGGYITKSLPPFMTSAPSIVCWEADHVRLVTIASIVFVIYYSVAAVYVSRVIAALLRDEQASGASQDKNAIYYSSPLLLLLFQVKVIVSFIVSYWGGLVLLPDRTPITLFPAYITSLPLALLLCALIYYNTSRQPANVELLNAFCTYALTFALAVTVSANFSVVMDAVGLSLTDYVVCLILLIWIMGVSIHYFANYSGGRCMCFQPRSRAPKDRRGKKDASDSVDNPDGFLNDGDLVDMFATGPAPAVPNSILATSTSTNPSGPNYAPPFPIGSLDKTIHVDNETHMDVKTHGSSSSSRVSLQPQNSFSDTERTKRDKKRAKSRSINPGSSDLRGEVYLDIANESTDHAILLDSKQRTKDKKRHSSSSTAHSDRNILQNMSHINVMKVQNETGETEEIILL